MADSTNQNDNSKPESALADEGKHAKTPDLQMTDDFQSRTESLQKEYADLENESASSNKLSGLGKLMEKALDLAGDLYKALKNTSSSDQNEEPEAEPDEDAPNASAKKSGKKPKPKKSNNKGAKEDKDNEKDDSSAPLQQALEKILQLILEMIANLITKAFEGLNPGASMEVGAAASASSPEAASPPSGAQKKEEGADFMSSLKGNMISTGGNPEAALAKTFAEEGMSAAPTAEAVKDVALKPVQLASSLAESMNESVKDINEPSPPTFTPAKAANDDKGPSLKQLAAKPEPSSSPSPDKPDEGAKAGRKLSM